MNQQRLQDLLAKVKTANDEKEGLLARARAYAQQNPAAAGTAGAGGTAALLAALFSKRGNRLRNALLAGGLGAGAGYGAGRMYPGALDGYRARQESNRRLLEGLRQEAEAQSAVTDSNTNHGGEVASIAKETKDKASDVVAPRAGSLWRDIKNIPGDIKRKGRTAGDALDTLAAWAGYIGQRKNISRMQAQKELRERRARQEGSTRRLLEGLRQEAEAQSAVTDSNTNHGGDPAVMKAQEDADR